MTLFNKCFNWLTKLKCIFGAILLFILIFNYVDRPLLEIINVLSLSKINFVLIMLTTLGSAGLYFLGFLIAALLSYYFYKSPLWFQRFTFLLLCLSFSSAILLVLKISLGRARPERWLQWHEYGFYGWKLDSAFWSFPSGHTTTVTALALALAILFPLYRYFYFILALLIAFSRILLMKHYLSDVLFSAYLTLLELALLLYFLKKKEWLKLAWQAFFKP